MLSSLATLHGPAMAEKKTRMEWPEPLVGDRGEPVFYGPEVEATTVIVAPEEEDAGDEEYLEDDMDETNKHVGPREVSVKVRATVSLAAVTLSWLPSSSDPFSASSSGTRPRGTGAMRLCRWKSVGRCDGR